MPRRRIFLLTILPLLVVGPATGSAPADEAEEADAQFLREYRVGAEGPALLAFFRQRTLTPADESRLRRLVVQLGDERFAAREQASRELASKGPAALPLLRPALSGPDPEVARRARDCVAAIERGPGPLLPAAAARMLARRAPPGATAALLAYVPFADDAAVEDEVLAALATLTNRARAADSALPPALADPTPARRAAAAYALGRLPAASPAVRKLLADPDPAVRLRAAQGLIAGRDRDAVPALIALLADAPTEVAGRAEEVLGTLAEERAPAAAPGEGPGARRALRDAWEKWWRDHGKEIDLTRPGESAPYLGLTLIAQADVGKVWECGRDGKPRWTISGLVWPMEARMLPGGRVLVVETQARRVSERDTRGKILWEYRAPDNVLSARRLSNGRTFLVTNSTVGEVTRDGREVYRHPVGAAGGGGRVMCACRLPSGRLLVLTSDGALNELDAATGKVVRAGRAPGGACYSVEPLPGGGCLVACYGGNKVVELNAAGKEVWDYPVAGAFHATRLPDGHTLIATHSGKRVIEVTRERKVVWAREVDGHVWRAYRR